MDVSFVISLNHFYFALLQGEDMDFELDFDYDFSLRKHVETKIDDASPNRLVKLDKTADELSNSKDADGVRIPESDSNDEESDVTPLKNDSDIAAAVVKNATKRRKLSEDVERIAAPSMPFIDTPAKSVIAESINVRQTV